ncbi:MAG: type II toxin-antitoxin system VapC family toxin [Acidobacteria bacterium]|nr:type II toxin-antitoxin system VapC family toxin [Acidobacteriota bacterium]
MSKYIVDASVAAKWVLPADHEAHHDEARRLLMRHVKGTVQLAVPDLFWPEMGNILWKSVKRGYIKSSNAQDGIDDLIALGLTSYPTNPLIISATKIAFQFDRTVYDSIYAALAIAIGAPMVTADERLANALAAYLPVRWLATFE